MNWYQVLGGQLLLGAILLILAIFVFLILILPAQLRARSTAQSKGGTPPLETEEDTVTQPRKRNLWVLVRPVLTLTSVGIVIWYFYDLIMIIVNRIYTEVSDYLYLLNRQNLTVSIMILLLLYFVIPKGDKK